MNNFPYSLRLKIQVNYEASGWVAHQVSDLWAKTSPDRGEAVWALWPMGGAWLCTHLWEHFTYTMDKVSSCCSSSSFYNLFTFFQSLTHGLNSLLNFFVLLYERRVHITLLIFST